MTGRKLRHDEPKCRLRSIEEPVRIELAIHAAHPRQSLPQGRCVLRQWTARGGHRFGFPLDDRTGWTADRTGGAALLVWFEPIPAAKDTPQTQHQKCCDHPKQHQIDRKTACTHTKLPPRQQT